MKRLKLFAAAALSLLMIAGVLASNRKTSVRPVNNLYYYTGFNYPLITANVSPNVGLYYFSSGTPTGSQATIQISGISYGLYDIEGTGVNLFYCPVY